jgi:hypothetical protein
MTDFAIRLFADDAAVSHVGERLLARSLPREEWTHEAHLAACLWLVRERPDILPERDMPDIIRRHNESVGTVNDDRQGYHETLTLFYIATVRDHHAATGGCTLTVAVNRLLQGERGHRDWPLRFYSRDLLFSVGARRKFVEPDLLPLSAMAQIG